MAQHIDTFQFGENMSDKINQLLADGGAAADRRIVLVPEKAAAYVGDAVTVQTLANRRMRGLPPAYVKLGSRIAYEIAELDRWIASCRVLPTVTDEPPTLSAPPDDSLTTPIGTPPGDAPRRKRGQPRRVLLAGVR